MNIDDPSALGATSRRIVFVTPTLCIGGAERQLVQLATGLHRSGWAVTVVSCYDRIELESGLDAAGVPLICLHKRGRWDIAGMLWRLRKVLVALRPQVVHGYMLGPNLALTVLRPFTGGACLVWGVRSATDDVARGDFFVLLMRRLGVVLSRFAHLIICNSAAGRAAHAADGYAAQRMVVIPNGIDLARFAPDSDARREVRSEWGVADAHRLVGHVARFDPRKDHLTFLKAASLVTRRLPDARFVCVGGRPGSHSLRLVRLVESLGLADKVIWAGLRHDMARVYNALDLTVSSSLTEGLPNAIAESMATGLPCVATDVGDCSELMRGLGTVCPPGDSEKLAQAIMSALTNAPPCPSSIRQRIRERYSEALLLERTEGHLLSALRDHGAADAPHSSKPVAEATGAGATPEARA